MISYVYTTIVGVFLSMGFFSSPPPQMFQISDESTESADSIDSVDFKESTKETKKKVCFKDGPATLAEPKNSENHWFYYDEIEQFWWSASEYARMRYENSELGKSKKAKDKKPKLEHEMLEELYRISTLLNVPLDDKTQDFRSHYLKEEILAFNILCAQTQGIVSERGLEGHLSANMKTSITTRRKMLVREVLQNQTWLKQSDQYDLEYREKALKNISEKFSQTGKNFAVILGELDAFNMEDTPD